MKKSVLSLESHSWLSRYKYLIIMKIIVALILSCLMHLQAETIAQTVSISKKNADIVDVFREIKRQTGYNVLCSSSILKQVQKVDVDLKNMPLELALSSVLEPKGLTYRVDNKNIVVIRKPRINNKSVNEASSEDIQQNIVKGTVRDKEGEFLSGVSVTVKGNTVATATDEEGNFEIPASVGDILLFTSVGYATKEVGVTSSAQITVTLEVGQSDLEEVVVVGYGVQKKVNLTGAVDVINSEQLTKQPVGQSSAALQGASPGLTVTQASGQPGRDVGGIKIRGIGTLGDSNPLVLIDGVEGNINHVNPNDIASVSVLKDASSAAIYGSRAANGVILVTTKRANNDNVSVAYNNYMGWQSPTEMTKMVNGLDHMNLLNEAYTNTGKSPIFTQQMIDDYANGVNQDSDRFPNTDWQRLTMKNNAFMQNHYLSAQGGTDKAKVLASFGYFDQGGILDNTNFKRYNFRLNSDLKISEKLNAAIDFSFVKSELKEPTGGTGNIFHWMRRIPANQAGILSTGQYGEGWNGDNPIAKARDGGLNLENPMTSTFNIDINYKPIDDVTISLVYSPKYEIRHRKTFANTIQSYYPDGSKAYLTPQKNSLTESYNQYWYNNVRAIVSYDKTFSNDHNLSVMGGFQQEDQLDNMLSAYREVFLVPELQEINAGNRENDLTGGNASHWSLRSVFGRLNYNYRGKYLLEGNMRYDGSSRFAPDNRYSFFPSFSAGWRISEESFMQSLSPILNELKLRASWGKLGNQNIGLYPFAAFFNLGANNYVFGENTYTGAALSSLANPEIRWESTTVNNIGLDVMLLKNFSVTADYYYRKTSGILLQLDIPKILGQNPPYQNAGVVENRGWDLTMAYKNNINDLHYNIAVNLSDVKNKVLDMRGVMRTGLTVNHEGHPIGSLYGYEAIGYFNSEEEVANHATQFGAVAPGDIKYKDQNGDGVINADDEIIMGSPIPRYSFSTNLGLSYKGFDFAAFLQGVGKADGYLYGQGIMPFYQGGTIQEQHKDRWTPENHNAAFPRYAFNETNNIQNSTFWMKNASYLRLKNLTVGYTLSTSQIQSLHINSLRLFFSGQNLFTKTKFWKGYDPEGPVSTGGWYPQMKVYSLGISAKF